MSVHRVAAPLPIEEKQSLDDVTLGEAQEKKVERVAAKHLPPPSRGSSQIRLGPRRSRL